MRRCFNQCIRLLLALILLQGTAGVTAAPLRAEETAAPGQAHESSPAEDETSRRGIRILHLRLVAENHLLDLRYRVIDPEKAKFFMSRERTAYLVDQQTGKALPVPVTKSGAMRQTTLEPESGREYFMFFSNPGDLIEAGRLMTLAVGDIRIRNLRVENPAAPLNAERRENIQNTKIKAWRSERQKLRQAFAQCSDQCLAPDCLDQCRSRLADREQSAYARIVYGRADTADP